MPFKRYRINPDCNTYQKIGEEYCGLFPKCKECKYIDYSDIPGGYQTLYETGAVKDELDKLMGAKKSGLASQGLKIQVSRSI